ncbi:MAG: metallophosphoesterase [Ignavibacteria bacterium]|nr:metallophosphoesterase [Ignavibacteria bacterium]
MKLKEIKRMPMVNWFDVGQLTNTAIKMIFSTVIGQQSDKRIIQALSSVKKDFYDYSCFYEDDGDKPKIDRDKPRLEMWLDYISDTGDGWSPTYAVAYYASNPELALKINDKTFKTKRGEVLIFGGDEVYPTPSKEAYNKRLIMPYEAAFGDDKPEHKPHVFAIPGNHDWYDGLEAFSRVFSSDLDRTFAGWLTRQRRSYFALKLPAGWWLLGSDGQLQSDIDTPQIEYFRNITEKYMQVGDKVILCISQPNWIYAHKYKEFNQPYDESDLIYLQNEILAKKNIDVKVYLSGDYHHYRRHEETKPKDSNAKVQKITAGGGGAFLHPTNDIDVSLITENYGSDKKSSRKFALKKSYPDVETSKKLAFKDLLFLFLNPGFGIITASLYLLTAWMVGATLNFQAPSNLLETFYLTAKAFKDNPFVALWIFLVFGLFIMFTDTHSKIYKWGGGFLHCLAHMTSTFYIGWGSLYVTTVLFGEDSLLQFITAFGLIFGLGWVIGSVILGIYLFISMYFFGRHNEEAFSALKIQDYKNFLRLHISGDGTLTIYPIKLHKVARKWRDRKENEKDKIKSYIVPLDGSGAELIEEPIILKPNELIN